MPTILREDERQKLQSILVGILGRDPYDKEQERYMLVKEAGLEDIVSGIDLSGSRLTVAEELIACLEDYGPLPDQLDTYALGALLKQLLTLEPEWAEAKFIAYLIVEHRLVGNDFYLSELRAEYVGVPTMFGGDKGILFPRAADDEPETSELTMEEDKPRYANIVLVDAQRRSSLGKNYRMKPGDETVLRVDIGALSADSLVSHPGSFPEDSLPQDEELWPIDVMVTSSEFRLGDEASVAHGRLFLPRDKREPARTKDGEKYLYFPLYAPLMEVWAHVRVGFYYENNLLQSYKVVASIGGTDPVYAEEEPDFSISQAFSLSETTLDAWRRNPRRLTILTNDNVDGSYQLVLRGEGGAGTVAGTFKLNSQAVGGAVAELRKALWKISPQKEKLSKSQLIEHMRALAPLGYKLWIHIMGQFEDFFEVADLLQASEAPIIQVTRPDTGSYVFPWGLLYDIPVDSEEEFKVCPSIDGLLNGTIPEGTRCCPEVVKSGKPHAGNTLCPFGFWGYRYAIEQLSSTKSLETQIPTPGDIEMAVGLTQYDVNRNRLAEHVKWLEENLGGVKMRQADTRAKIKDALHDPDLQLVYFYCHGHYDDDAGKDVYLGIGNKEKLSGEDFTSWLHDWRWQDRIKVWDQVRPLVFINACHSLDILPDSLVSLLKAFMGHANAAGIIGTEVRVDQNLGYRIAEMFFDEFVNERKKVWEALQTIRFHFLCQGNLFGLIYTPYCSADLQLQPKNGN